MVGTEMGDLAESYLREYRRSRAAAGTGPKLDLKTQMRRRSTECSTSSSPTMLKLYRK